MLEQYIANQYLRALVILVGSMVILRSVLTIFYMILKRAAKHTKTDADDLLIERSRNPLTLWLFLVSIRIGIEQLTLNPTLDGIVNNTISTLVVISLAYVLYLIFDIIIFKAIKNFVKRTKTEIDDGIMGIIQNALKVALIIIAFLYILDLWGVQIGPFLAGLGIAGLAISLALQPTLSNIFSGISLILDKSVRVGDLVYLDADTKGTIEHIGYRSTRLRTFDNEIIIVPNNKLADSNIQNVALPEPKSRVVIAFSAAYGSNIDKVKKIVLKEIRSIKKVCKDPEPLVRFIEMGQSSLNFKVYFWVNHFSEKWDCIDEANTKIYNALTKNKIEIPFPQLDVHLKKK